MASLGGRDEQPSTMRSAPDPAPGRLSDCAAHLIQRHRWAVELQGAEQMADWTDDREPNGATVNEVAQPVARLQ